MNDADRLFAVVRGSPSRSEATDAVDRRPDEAVAVRLGEGGELAVDW